MPSSSSNNSSTIRDLQTHLKRALSLHWPCEQHKLEPTCTGKGEEAHALTTPRARAHTQGRTHLMGCLELGDTLRGVTQEGKRGQGTSVAQQVTRASASSSRVRQPGDTSLSESGRRWPRLVDNSHLSNWRKGGQADRHTPTVAHTTKGLVVGVVVTTQHGVCLQGRQAHPQR